MFVDAQKTGNLIQGGEPKGIGERSNPLVVEVTANNAADAHRDNYQHGAYEGYHGVAEGDGQGVDQYAHNQGIRNTENQKAFEVSTPENRGKAGTVGPGHERPQKHAEAGAEHGDAGNQKSADEFSEKVVALADRTGINQGRHPATDIAVGR